jgi:hypothetical protein
MVHPSETKRTEVDRSLREYYLLEPGPESLALVEALPRHPSWQAPLWVPCRDPDELERRILTAGELWLACFDIGPSNLLIVSCPERGFYFVFQRCQGRGSDRLMLGPVEGVLTGCSPIGPNGLFFELILEPLSEDPLAE